MRFAYADPPYLGCCGLYGHHHPDGLCWDHLSTHEMLIVRLRDDYPDGWAMSLHTPSLRVLLPLCPYDVRIGAWCKSFGAFKKGVRPAYMWEPVIFRGGRNPVNGYMHQPPEKGGPQNTPKDFIVAPITLQRGLTGAKPEKVARWIFDMLNAKPDDELVDLFPGSGAVTEAWNKYPSTAAAGGRLMFATICCFFGFHAEPLWDRVQGVYVWRCPLCWKVRVR